MRPQKIIIDKDTFIGINLNALCIFTRSHFLVLPEVLLYECLTSLEKKGILLDRFRQVILAGGYVCSSGYAIVRDEAHRLNPHGPLVNREYSDGVRQALAKNADPYDYTWVTKRFQLDQEFIDHFQSNIERFTKLESRKTNVIELVRRQDHSNEGRSDRLKYWAEFVNSKDLHDARNQLLKGITNCPDKYCLSGEWVSWQFVRVFMIWVLECSFLLQTGGGKGSAKLEHDLQDIACVALLSRANGLLVRDKFAQDLARAAFPDKDVFSSLDEVPDEYLCDWG